jgi:hypothetical protein
MVFGGEQFERVDEGRANQAWPGIKDLEAIHYEAYKLEALASTKLEAFRLGKYTPAELAKLPLTEAQKIKRRLHAVLWN